MQCGFIKRGPSVLMLLSLFLPLGACGDEPGTLDRQRSNTSGSVGSSGSSGDPGSSSGSTTSGSSGTASSSGTTAEEICVATMNEYRKAAGLAPYARWAENETCTASQAASDGALRQPHGAFGKCGENAQTECPGWPGPPGTMIPKCLKSMMDEGPGGGHHDAIVNPKYTKVSCGFAAAPGGAIWAVQNFR